MDANELIPNSEEYDTFSLKNQFPLKDALLSRQALTSTVNKIRSDLLNNNFNKDCSIKIAFLATYSTPQPLTITTPLHQTFTVNTQRAVIPLLVETNKNGKLIFKNNFKYRQSQSHNFNHIFLPTEIDNPDGNIDDHYIEIEHVLRAVLASSAFPFAFGQVKLNYIKSNSSIQPKLINNYKEFLKQFTEHEDYFIDGGLFDNVPLGVAVDLYNSKSNEKNKNKQRGNFIYIDPSKRRINNHKKSDDPKKDLPLTIREQLSVVFETFDTLRNQILYQTIVDDFMGKEDGYILLLTERFPPLTGDYLYHFGAFLDLSFRYYDYSAGIYDGLMNIVDYLCDPDTPQYIGKERTVLFKELVQTHIKPEPNNQSNDAKEKIHQLLGLFIKIVHNKGDHWDTPQWEEIYEMFPKPDKLSAEYAVFNAQFSSNVSTFDDFLASLNKFLKKNDGVIEKFGEPLQWMLKNPDDWYKEISTKILERLIKIEKEKDETLKISDTNSTTKKIYDKELMKIGNVFLHSSSLKNGDNFHPSSPLNKNIPFYIPDGFGIDAGQTGVTISWLREQPLPFPGYLEWDASLHLEVKDTPNEWGYYASLGAFYRQRKDGNYAWSSWGIGPTINQNMTGHNKNGHDVLFGGEVSIGLINDMLRLTVGTRDIRAKYPGEDWTIRLGVTDIKSLIYLLKD